MKEKPDSSKWSEMFNLDDLLTFLVEDFEIKTPGLLKHSVKDHRALARSRAEVNLKIHGLFRSDCCLHMQRGSLFDSTPPVSTDGSHWGPMDTLLDGSRFPRTFSSV